MQKVVMKRLHNYQVYFFTVCIFVSDIAIFVLKRDVKLQLTNLQSAFKQ